VQSLNGGLISGNTILHASQQPDDYINFTGSGETLAQLQADFRQPVVVANSANVSSSGNITSGVMIANVSQAGGGPRLSPGAMASAIGTNLSTSTVVAPGIATVAIGNAVSAALIGPVAPGLFSADGSGSGVALALAVRTSADGAQTPLTVYRCDAGPCIATPLDLGADTDQLVVQFYPTGIEGFSSLDNVVAQVERGPGPGAVCGSARPGSRPRPSQQVIPPSLAGAGEVPLGTDSRWTDGQRRDHQDSVSFSARSPTA
jgi:hypothetical protein